MSSEKKLADIFFAFYESNQNSFASNEAFIEAAYSKLLGLNGNFNNKNARVSYWAELMEKGELSREGFAEIFIDKAKNTKGDLLGEEDFQQNQVVVEKVVAKITQIIAERGEDALDLSDGDSLEKLEEVLAVLDEVTAVAQTAIEEFVYIAPENDSSGEGEEDAADKDISEEGGGLLGGGGSPSGPTFTVSVTDNVITFSGTAKGDITFSAAYDENNQVYDTFYRGGVKASQTANLDTDSIHLASGQTLLVPAKDADGLMVTGTGSVKVSNLETGKTQQGSSNVITNLADIKTSSLTVTVEGSLTYTGNLGSAVVTLSDGATLSAAASILSGKTIKGVGSLVVDELGDSTNLSMISVSGQVVAKVPQSISISANSNLSAVDEYQVASGQTLTLTSQQAAAKLTGSGSVSVMGTDNKDSFSVGTTGTNTIQSGGGADDITLGSGSDTLIARFGGDRPGSATLELVESELSAGDIINFTVTGSPEKTFTVGSEKTVNSLVDSINADAELKTVVVASNEGGALKLIAKDSSKSISGSFTNKTPQDDVVSGSATEAKAAIGGSVSFTINESRLTDGDTVKFTVTGGSEKTFTVSGQKTVDALVTAINNDSSLNSFVTASKESSGALKLLTKDSSKSISGNFSDKTPAESASAGSATPAKAATGGSVTFSIDGSGLSAGDTVKFTVTGGSEKTFTVSSQGSVDSLVSAINSDSSLNTFVTASNESGALKLASKDASKNITGRYTDTTADESVDATAEAASSESSGQPIPGYATFSISESQLSAGDQIVFKAGSRAEKTFTLQSESSLTALASSINQSSDITTVEASVVDGALRLTAITPSEGVTGRFVDKTADKLTLGTSTDKSAAEAAYLDYSLADSDLSGGDLIRFTLESGSEKTFTVGSETSISALVTSINKSGELSPLVTASTTSSGQLRLTSDSEGKDITGSFTNTYPSVQTNGQATENTPASGGSLEFDFTSDQLSQGDLIKFTLTGGSEQTITVGSETSIDQLVSSINQSGSLSPLVTASKSLSGGLRLTADKTTAEISGTFTNTYADTTTVANVQAKQAGVATDSWDQVTGFAIGSDKVDLQLVSGAAVATPSKLTRVDDVTSSDSVSQALLSAFSNLSAGEAGLVVIKAGDAAGTYLYADDGNGSVEINNDVFIQLLDVDGSIGAVGTLTASDYFA